MAAMVTPRSTSSHSQSLPIPSSTPTRFTPSVVVQSIKHETPAPRYNRDSRSPTKPTPLATFRLPANPHPSTPSRSAPSTPSRSSTPRIVNYTSQHFVEFEPFVASPPSFISPLPQQSHTFSRYLGVPSFMSSNSSVIDSSDGGFEHFERAQSTLSDATYDGGYSGSYECSSEPYYSSTPAQSYADDIQCSQPTTLGKRSWEDEEEDPQTQGSYTPSRQQQKRFRVEPITPITPSSSFTTHHDEYSSTPSSIHPVARTLSYGAAEFSPMPTLNRSNTYHGHVETQRPLSARSSLSQNDVYAADFHDVHYGGDSQLTAYPHSSSSSPGTESTPFLTCTTAQTSYFEDTPCDDYPQTPALLASPLLIPHTAPIERGHFQPYPDLESTSMSLSYSLPQPPQQYQVSPRQGRTIHSKRDEFDVSSSPTTPRRGELSNNFQLHSPVSPNYAGNYSEPALVPIPSSSTPPSASRRSSNASNYTPNQAALVSAASMNRLLSRIDSKSSPIKSSGGGGDVEAVPSGRGVCAIHPRYRVPSPPRKAAPPSPVKVEKLHFCVEQGCGRKFKRLEHLKRHERTHTMEKPYGCDIPGCGRYFSRSDNLAQHRKTHDRNGKTSRAMAAAAAARENAARAAAEAAAASQTATV